MRIDVKQLKDDTMLLVRSEEEMGEENPYLHCKQLNCFDILVVGAEAEAVEWLTLEM